VKTRLITALPLTRESMAKLLDTSEAAAKGAPDQDARVASIKNIRMALEEYDEPMVGFFAYLITRDKIKDMIAMVFEKT
jgi:hypothetical protein